LLSFAPSAKLEKALKSVQADINRLAAELALVSEAEAAWLTHWALISTIGASTRIENAVLTDAEVDWVDTILSQSDHATAFDANKATILDKLSKDRERSVEEVAGCRGHRALKIAQCAGARNFGKRGDVAGHRDRDLRLREGWAVCEPHVSDGAGDVKVISRLSEEAEKELYHKNWNEALVAEEAIGRAARRTDPENMESELDSRRQLLSYQHNRYDETAVWARRNIDGQCS
jgi:hypothetical protein